MTKQEALFQFTLGLADDALIIGHRVSEWCGKGPILEEDIALTNIALDLIGQATSLFEYAAEVQNEGNTADDLAFLRYATQYKNHLMCEQVNGDFGKTITRQFFFSVFQQFLYNRLIGCNDEQISAISEKSLKEVKYHVKHAAEWMIRLGDGTEDSHNRVQESVTDLWRYTDELFLQNEAYTTLVDLEVIPALETIETEWRGLVDAVLKDATLSIPESGWQQKGGRNGMHTEHLGFLLAEMQYMQRAYPGMEW